MTSARETAFRTLYEIFENDAYSNLALKMALKGDISREDKGLVTNLVYGVVSRRITLDYVISKYSSIKLRKLSDNIRIILEMGIYQLMYTDKIPQSAAVNESVKLAKKHGRKGTDRFVNAVLRSFCRDDCSVEYPSDKTDYLSIKYSFPKNITEKWLSDYGFSDTERLMASLIEPPKLMLRANTLKITAEELVKKLCDYGINSHITEGALISAEGFDIAKNKLYKEGYFSVQDRGAYNAALALAPKENETIIDMCAAPGGKTTHIAELQKDTGRIIACDVHEHKIKLINESAARLGIHSIEARLADGSVKDETLIKSADRVLCDVPCSGWGIVRRKPDIKLGRNDTSELPKLQLAILKNAAEYVKDSGIIVYSTCTINKDENEKVTDELVKDGSFKKLYEKTFMPYNDGSDGFYICKLEREGDTRLK